MARSLLLHILIISFALSILFIPTSQARVFQLLGGSQRIAAVLRQTGGRTAYTSDITLNGGDARLTIIGVPGEIRDVAKSLRSTLGDSAFSDTSGGLLRTRFTKKDGVTRVLLAYLPTHSQTIAFLVEQTRTEAERTDRGGATEEIPGVAVFPDSVPHFSARDTRVNVTFNVMQSAASIDTIQTWHASELSRDGWSLMAPTTTHATGGMQVFSRGSDLCCVYIHSATDAEQNTITLLHKKPGIE